MSQVQGIVMNTFAKGITALLLVAMVAAVAFVMNIDQAEAASTVYVGQKVPAGSRIPMDQINHSPWDALLRKYVDDDGFVNYRAWHASTPDRQALTAYLNHLSLANPKQAGSRDAKLAFWINAYNAVTIHGILREYPTSSIRNHTPRVFGYNIWKDLQLLVGGRAYSLEEIEHQVLRKMGEPRIHFAIVCASISCPRLRNEAYTAGKLEQQLTDNAVDFFSRRQNLRVDAGNRTLYLSSILKWFRDDFGGSQAEMLASIKPYLPPAARRLADDPQNSVGYLDYNWDLNDQRTKPRTASLR